MQTDLDRMARQNALTAALKQHEGYGDADDVVETAEAFRAFLAGETTTTSEGTK